MKFIKIILLVVFLVSCARTETDEEKIKRVISESLKLMQDKDFSAKLSPENTATVTDISELRKICEEIMAKVGQSDMDSAFTIMKKYTILPEKEMDNVLQSTKTQLSLVKNRFGEFIGYEFIKEEAISGSMIRFIYIAKCENHALPWTFIFYRAKDKWTLNYFIWNDKIQDL